MTDAPSAARRFAGPWRGAARLAVLAAALLAAAGLPVRAAAQVPESRQVPELTPVVEPARFPESPNSPVIWRDGLPRFSGPPEGPVYTWRDGERTRRVFLQTGLVVSADGAAEGAGAAPGRESLGAIVSASSASGVGGHPVFRSPSGSLMTLPGGVLLIFDGDWSEAETDAFFARQAISKERLSPLGEIPGGFTVETEPGFASLDLANSLSELEGVVVASPNWWQELVTR